MKINMHFSAPNETGTVEFRYCHQHHVQYGRGSQDYFSAKETITLLCQHSL
jgi:hypothetical protein